MSETTTPAAKPAPLWRRMLFNPLLWGTALLVAALFALRGDPDFGVFPLILMIVGGWFFGFAFVNLTLRMPRHGLLLHLGVGVALIAAVLPAADLDDRVLSSLPEELRLVVTVLRVAVLPAAAWIWMGLFARASDRIMHRARARAEARVAPQWERDEGGDGSFVVFRAIEMRMRTLTTGIVCVTVVAGLAAVAVVIGLGDVTARLGPRLFIVLLGLVLGLSVYLMLMAYLRRRTRECTLAFGNDELRIRLGDSAYVVRFAELDHLRWRSRSDYARVEVRGADVDLSLFSGIAKAPPGVTPELPALPKRVLRRLELAGLVLEKSRRGEVLTFGRPV